MWYWAVYRVDNKQQIMFIQEVSLNIHGADPDDVYQEMDLLLGLYRQSGQKQGKVETQYTASGRIVALPYTLEVDSLATCYNNDYVNRQLDRLQELTGQAVHIQCMGATGPEPLANVCQCPTTPFYLLHTDYVTLLSPVRCGGCNGSVPLYRLRCGGETSFYSLLSWETNYQSCDSLQMNCTVGERWATRQLSDIHSALSKEGRGLAAELEAVTGVPVYYYLYNYRALSLAKDQQRPCPVCGQPWLLSEPLHDRYDFQCTTDRLISELTSNSH
ncbi:DNA-binding protein [Hymenobacter perfusus]|uniref:DNA-binding protein n=2 Tax=Hymenobacter perfusus TaxID=1236770 RepID=A0A428KDQ2_9BACT|nr:DNA-binding protein [Hymenobacter perfusus]